MKKTIIFLLMAIITISGCNNLSPRADPKIDQKIDNQNGKIGQIESIQNGLKADIGKLQNQSDIQNSKLDKVQQGLLNVQSNNSGIMIFSGTGGLVVGILTIFGMVIAIVYYRNSAIVHEKTANILAEKIVSLNDPQVENSIFESTMHTNVAENMLNLLKKKKSNLSC